MGKIKILQFTVANSQGGSTQLILQWWKFIDKSKFQFDFVTMNNKLDFANQLEQDGCRIFYISCYAEENRQKFVDEMREILSQGHYDVVHLHTKFWKSFIVEQLAKEAGVKKIIIHAHNTGIDTLDAEKRAQELAMHKSLLNELTEDIATDYWTCSKMAADFLFGDRISDQKVRLIKNAIELSKYEYDPQIRKKYRDKIGIKNEYLIGNVGRLVYQKNQEFLLVVFAQLCKNCDSHNYKLLLVGSGDREEEYRKIAKQEGIEKNVIFAGQRSDVAALLQTMDIFCLPSHFEGLPVSLIEAQASGLPCIISDTITDEVIINDNVVQVPLDVQLWKINILKYCNGKNVRKSGKLNLTENGYNLEKQMLEIQKEYEKID